jgi:hypothetical protein
LHNILFDRGIRLFKTGWTQGRSGDRQRETEGEEKRRDSTGEIVSHGIMGLEKVYLKEIKTWEIKN